MSNGCREEEISLFEDAEEEQHLWEVREGGLGATAFSDGNDHWPGWEDSAVPPERIGDYLRDLKRLYDEYGYRGAMYGHVGQGCVHSRIDFDLRTPEGLKTYRRFMEAAADLVVSYGGSALRRARRRPAARRAAPEDVRRGARRRLPRVQVGVGPGLEDEPGQGGRPLPAGREPQARRRLQPVAPEGRLRLPGGQGRLRALRAPLRRRRQVPDARRGGRDVPELHRHEGGDALDPRPGAPPLRDAPGRGRRPTAGEATRCSRRSTSASPARAARTTAR